MAALILFGCVKEPRLETSEKPEPIGTHFPEAYVLTLKLNKQIEMNGVTYEFQNLRRAFEEAKEEEETVLLRAQADTPAADVVELVDRIKELGFTKIYVSTIND